MLRSIKRFWWMALLAVGVQPAWGFALLGPFPLTPNAPDGWQIPTIGYLQNTFGFVIGAYPGGPVSLGDIGFPKNLGEGYRRNTPVIYYTYDANFLGYFGSNGVAAVDSAFAIMNRAFTTNPVTGQFLTNGVDGFSTDLSEYPPESLHINYKAQSLFLTDLKSVTLHCLVEQLGLATPERYTWTLAERTILNPPLCPQNVVYLVVQRNYDITASPLNQLQYSPYVNDTLYTYEIAEFCGPPNPVAITVPYNVDPFADVFTAVAADNADGLGIGGYYTGLTRDDMAGFRYLLTSNNISRETAAFIGQNGPVITTSSGNSGAGAANLLLTNTLSAQPITTLPLNVLLSQALTNDPAALQGLYPGLTFASVTTNIASLTTTNIAIYYANQPYYAGPGTNGTTVTNFGFPPQFLVTGDLGLLLGRAATNDPATLQGLYPGLLLTTVTNFAVQTVTNTVLAYTNQPGPTVTNLGTIQLLNPPPNTVPPPITSGTIDFGLFSLQALTNTTGQVVNPALAIAQLQALYPGLLVLSATPYFTAVTTTNFITTLNIPTGQPFPPALINQTVSISGIFTNYEFLYNYTFGNLMLDSNGTFYPFVDYTTSRSLYNTNETVTNIVVSVTNLIGAPVGSPQMTNITTTPVRQYGITGDFFILPTNWCGFTIVTPLAITKLISYSNTITATGTTNNVPGVLTNATAQFSQTTIHTYTNRQFIIEPGVCEPVLTNIITITSSNVLTYQNTLLNVVTINSNSSSFITLITTNIFTTNGVPAGTVITNITQVSLFTNSPTGDFFILPTNWCGYKILATNTPTVITTTNTVATAGPVPIFSAPGVQSGVTESFSLTVISEFTNHTLVIQPGVCEPLLQFSTNITTAFVTNFQYAFGNVVTYTNAASSSVAIFTTNIFVVAWSNAVTLSTNVTHTNVMTSIPSGEFFILPATWCGYSIVSTQFATVTYNTNSLTVTTNTLAITGGGTTFFTTGGGVVVPAVNADVLYSETDITSSTNRTFLVQPQICSSAPFATGLRPGIQRIQFVRANFDSLLGQFFQPITNNYTMVLITNSQAVTQSFQRMVLAPDILLTAADDIAANTFDGTVTRNIVFDTDNVGAGLAGPGTINPRTTISYNKVGDAFQNGYIFTALNTNVFVLEDSQMPVLQWASFDASTNDPVLYPNGTSIANLQNQILIQISPPPPALPDGTNGVAYPATPFTASGGAFSPPFTWGLVPGLGALPPGMSLSGAGTLSGTPTQAGTFDFTIQLTDSLGRSVNWHYTLIIH